MNVLIWISGSVVDGVSSVKGLFKDAEFIAYKPMDYRKISDIDIGIGLDRIAYGSDIPAHLQSKDKININSSFGQKILSLCSDSIDKNRIRKEFSPVSAKKYLNLIEQLEPLKLKNISLKNRGIHLQFFLIDNNLPQSAGLHRFQRKFLVFSNFNQLNLTKEEVSQKIRVQGILKKTLGTYDAGLEQYIQQRISKGGMTKGDLNYEAQYIGRTYQIAKKKSQKAMREIISSLGSRRN